MKSGLRKYLNGEQNAVRDEFIISREGTGDWEHVHVSHPDLPEPLYQFWAGKKKKAKGAPKHTGGKKPYVMLMIEKLTGLIADGLPAESVGYLVCLAPYIEWGTGELKVGRKKRQMKVADIEKVFRKSHRHTLRIISDLKEKDLLYRTQRGYVVSRELLKKGGAAKK